MESTLLIQDGIGEKLALAIQFTCAFIFGLVVAMYYVWQLALLLCGIVPVLGFLIGGVAQVMTESAKVSAEAYNDAGSIATESLGSVRTVYAFGGEKKASSTYQTKLDNAEKAGVSKWTYTGSLAGTVSMVMWCAYALGLWFGSKLIADMMDDRESCRYRTNDVNDDINMPDDNCITGGDVMTCFFSILFGGLNLGQAFPAFNALTQARVELAKLLNVINRDSKIDSSSTQGITISSLKGNIEMNKVSFAYSTRKDHPIYNNMCLKIEAGTTVALVGPSGCGKSTMVSLIERFYDVDSGSLTLDGINVKELNVSWLRSQIGYVGQEPILFSGTIRDNISYGYPDANIEDVETAARQSNAHDFIMSFPDGYDTEVGERGIQLSGGQKQRIAIARAVVRNPQILILDEATSALDSTSEKVVQEALDKLLESKKRTTIIIAHRLSTIRNADKICVLSDGVLVEQGTHDELIRLKGGHYLELIKNSQK